MPKASDRSARYKAPAGRRNNKGNAKGASSLKRDDLLGYKREHNRMDDTLRAKVAPQSELLAATVPGLIEELARKEAHGPPLAVPASNNEAILKRRQLDLLKAYRNKELRRLCLEDPSGFWVFLYEVLYAKPDQKRNYSPDFHGPLSYELQHLPAGENLLLCIPREHRKTGLIMAYCTWLIVRDPDIRIKLVSNKLERAKALARFLREIFLQSCDKYPRFKEIFPDYLISSGQELLQAQQFTHPLRSTGYIDPTVFATFTGSTGAGGRADVLILDDPWDASTLSTPDQGVKVFQQLTDLFPLVEASSMGRYKNIIGTVTPWRYYDPTAIIMGLSNDPSAESAKELLSEMPFRVIVRHAKENPNKLCDICPPSVTQHYPHGAPDFTAGQPILAPIFDEAAISQRYKLYTMKPELGEQSFWLQYMCVYRSQSQDKFADEWFIRLDRSSWSDCKRRILVVDDASKDFQQLGRGDYSVAKFGEFDSEGRLLKVYALRSNKWTREQFINEILAWCQATRWWPQFAVKEKVGVDNFLVDIQRAFNSFGHPLVCVPAQRAGLGRKNDYIVGTLQGPYERREVLFGNLYPPTLYERDKYELMNLGSVAHDDMADADCLFFVEHVRVARGADYIRSRNSDWIPPQNLGLYDPRTPAEPSWVPSQDPSSQLEQVAFRAPNQGNFGPRFLTTADGQQIPLDSNSSGASYTRPALSEAFTSLASDVEQITFSPYESTSLDSPGFNLNLSGSDDSDWWPGG